MGISLESSRAEALGNKNAEIARRFCRALQTGFRPLGYWSCLHKHVSYPAAAGRHSIPSRNSAENQPEITVRMLGEKIVARYSTFSWWWPYHRMFVRPDRRRSENYGAGFMTEVAIRLHSASSIHLPHANMRWHIGDHRLYAIAYESEASMHCRPISEEVSSRRAEREVGPRLSWDGESACRKSISQT